MFVIKSRTKSYSILSRDGPCLTEFGLTPLIVVLAQSRILQVRRKELPEIFMSMFLKLGFVSTAAMVHAADLEK
jgi:hypothetical protein